MNNHPLLAEQIRAQELGMLHSEQHRCLDCLKMDLRQLWNAIEPGTASPKAPNKLQSQGALQWELHRHNVQVWFPRQSLALDVGSRSAARWESRNNTPSYTSKGVSGSSVVFSFPALLNPTPLASAENLTDSLTALTGLQFNLPC